MRPPTPSLEYPPSLEEFAVPDKEYLALHPECNILCTGVVVFGKDGKLLLVQRAADEKAFPNAWSPKLANYIVPGCLGIIPTSMEIPGGKVDDTDETIFHAAARELKEEAGLEATRVVRMVNKFTFVDGRPNRNNTWQKLIFEMEVKDVDNVVLDPVEHQKHLFASEEEVVNDLVGDVKLAYVTPENKAVKLEAFRLRREG